MHSVGAGRALETWSGLCVCVFARLGYGVRVWGGFIWMLCVHSNLFLRPIFALIQSPDPSQVGSPVFGPRRAGQMMTKREIKQELKKHLGGR